MSRSRLRRAVLVALVMAMFAPSGPSALGAPGEPTTEVWMTVEPAAPVAGEQAVITVHVHRREPLADIDHIEVHLGDGHRGEYVSGTGILCADAVNAAGLRASATFAATYATPGTYTIRAVVRTSQRLCGVSISDSSTGSGEHVLVVGPAA